MHLELTAEQLLFRDTARRFIAAEAGVDAVRAVTTASDAVDRTSWQRAAALGWTSPMAPEHVGGGALSSRPLADLAIIAEEMGRQVATGPFLPVSMVIAALAAHAEQHEKELSSLVAGDTIATWALAEGGSRWEVSRGGHDPSGTTITPCDDGYRIRGAKRFVEAAAVADTFLVTGTGGEGLTQVLVPADAPGVSVRAARSLDLGRWFGEVQLDDVTVPASAVVGAVGAAAADVERQLQIAIALQCAETVGVMDRVFELTRAYMDQRFTFGRPISSYQALKHRTADMLLWLESAKATTDELTAAIEAGDPDSDVLASAAKSYVGDKSLTLIQECVQLHGGIGVTWEHDLHLYLRRATVNRAVLGSPEQHRDRLFGLLDLACAS